MKMILLIHRKDNHRTKPWTSPRRSPKLHSRLDLDLLVPDHSFRSLPPPPHLLPPRDLANHRRQRLHPTRPSPPPHFPLHASLEIKRRFTHTTKSSHAKPLKIPEDYS